MLWTTQDLVCGAFFHDFTGLHHGNAVAYGAHHIQVVADEEEGQPAALTEGLEQVQNLRLDPQIQRRHTLVQHQKLRRQRQRPRHVRWSYCLD